MARAGRTAGAWRDVSLREICLPPTSDPGNFSLERCADSMGHDVHFLERLDRLGTTEVEFALSLYRDAEMVRWILSRARLPDQAERVALAVTRDPRPPHIIVARNGRFVTCLAPGMSTYPHPLVPRAQLDRITGERIGYREALRRLAVHGESEDRVWSKVFAVGNRFTREDFQLCEMFAPIVESQLMGEFSDSIVRLSQMTPKVVRLRRRGRLTDELSESYWRGLYGASILAVLAFLPGERVWVREHTDAFMGSFSRVFWTLTSTLSSTILRRYAWCTGSAGRGALRGFKERYTQTWIDADVLHAWSGLAGIAAVHRGVRDEVLAHLEVNAERPPHGPDDVAGELRRQCSGLLAQHLAPAGDAAESVTARLEAASQRHLRDRLARVERRGQATSANVEIGSTYIASHEQLWADPTLDANARSIFLHSIPFTASLEPAQLFLPKEYIHTVQAWSREDVDLMLNVAMAEKPVEVPVRAAPTPGRNEKCPCGSGKKYKRCCGR